MAIKPLTVASAKAIISHSEDTEFSIGQFIDLFGKGHSLDSVYSGGKYKSAINATRVFGGYLSGALKIEPSQWADLTEVFFKKPEETAAVIAVGTDVLDGIKALKAQVDNAASTARAVRIAEGKVHHAAVSSMTKARNSFVNAGTPSAVSLAEFKAEVNAYNLLLAEIEANAEKLVLVS